MKLVSVLVVLTGSILAPVWEHRPQRPVNIVLPKRRNWPGEPDDAGVDGDRWELPNRWADGYVHQRAAHSLQVSPGGDPAPRC